MKVYGEINDNYDLNYINDGLLSNRGLSVFEYKIMAIIADKLRINYFLGSYVYITKKDFSMIQEDCEEVDKKEGLARAIYNLSLKTTNVNTGQEFKEVNWFEFSRYDKDNTFELKISLEIKLLLVEYIRLIS